MRVADGKGSNWTKAIGQADDYEEANGSTISTTGRHRSGPGQGRAGEDVLPTDDGPQTLRAALDQYEADLKMRGGDVANAVRVRRHLSELLDKPVADVTLNDLRSWRDRLTSKARRKNSDRRGTSERLSGIQQSSHPVSPIGHQSGLHGDEGRAEPRGRPR